MGVHGLWRLIEPSGKPVPLETLENKVLAVDISIWLHQAVKGFQDSKGASVPNAHLLGIYHRVCKLLYFKIKPVFVFDGGVPALKKQTIAKRTQSKLRNVAEADKIQRQLLSTLLKHTAVSKVLTEKIEASIGTVTKISPKQTKDDLYRLPPSELDSTISSSEDESETTTTDSSPAKNWDVHTIDMESVHFKSLPVDVRHEILTDLKETRKQSSWGRLHELPKVSDDFSVYQLGRLRKRQAVQAALEDAEKEMGGKSLSLAELESILKDQGVINNQNVGKRIASDETTKYLLVKDVKKAMEEAKKIELETEKKELEANEDIPIVIEEDEKLVKTKADEEYEDDLQQAIALSLQCEPSTSEGSLASDEPPKSLQTSTKAKTNPAEFSFLDNFTDADFASSSSDDEQEACKVREAKMSSAQSYMLEYSGLTPNEIAKIMKGNAASIDSKKSKSIKQVLPAILESNDKVLESRNEVDKQIKIDTIDAIKEPDKSRELQNNDDTVEIMSTDSSDSEIEEKIDTKKSIDIVINPAQQLEKEYDLFSDIFEETEKPLPLSINKSDKDSEQLFKKPASVPQKAIDIVINPNESVDKEDDLFSDVFSHEDKNFESQMDVVTGNESGDKITDTRGKLTNNVNLFSDDSVEDNKGENIAVIQDVSINKVEENTSKSTDKEHIKQPYNEQQSQIKKDERIALTRNKDNEINMEADPRLKKIKESKKETVTEQELMNLKNELQREKVDLLNKKSNKERIGGNITDQMYQEAQELLELFGVPYIVAPMEAEAQCAFLDDIELTDGTITDDSDIWLFGGKTVYKNFFNQSKYVMEFRAENITHHFKLTRKQMILLALLVGSDYTTGLQGVGPVTAVEILAAFPPAKGKINEFSLSHLELLSGLREFRSWFVKGKSPGPGRNALKSKLKNITFTENFPSLQVVEAYLEPKVETSREPFAWSKPNILALIEFAREKFGWTRNRSEDILNPVIKRMEEARHQRSIKDYFKTHLKIPSGAAESKMSKRVKTAITNMGRDPSEIIAEELEEELKKEPRKRAAPRKKKTGGVEAPEFNKKKSTSKLSNENDSRSEDKGPGSDNHFSENVKDTKKRNKGKTNIKKLKVNKEEPSTSQTTDNENVPAEDNNEANEESDILDKINQIRRRRKLKEAKVAIDIKKPKLTKEKAKKIVNEFQEAIPEGLEADEEINLLSQIAVHSSLKVDEINKTMQEKIDSLTAKTVQVPKQSTSQPTPSIPQVTPRVQRPISRPTRVPRKEVIPQKEKDKTTVLRNKLKAIEVFRKGKQGPGYVPKRERKKKLPKADAELSESSDE